MKTVSFALWCESPENSSSSDNSEKLPPIIAEMHYNFWKMPNKKKGQFTRFLDFGIKLDVKFDEKPLLKLFVPLIINWNNFEELGDVIKDNDLVCTVFNSQLETMNSANSNYIKVTEPGNSESEFYIYVLGSENISIDKEFKGTIITFKFTAPPQKESASKNIKTYIRFRIHGDVLSELGLVEEPSNAIFQSAFSSYEILDFRMNESRVLDNKLLERIQLSRQVKFSKTHFFFVCNSKEEYMFSHVTPIGCRRLENDKWEKYITKSFKLEKDSPILAYHWKKSEEHHEYSALIKTKYEQNDIITIIKYILFLLIFTLFANIVSNVIWEWLKIMFTNNDVPHGK